ncbi:unnamed protein product [Protopolystoma xenopodis]|uniref:Uncharacterized protein n=1 Tax=Protopolystoma xenopodis TaxID=117903 RepID=A0A3S5AT51_9PLAT|nr:unnamed protein product [Protopolystoma xenopodis]
MYACLHVCAAILLCSHPEVCMSLNACASVCDAVSACFSPNGNGGDHRFDRLESSGMSAWHRDHMKSRLIRQMQENSFLDRETGRLTSVNKLAHTNAHTIVHISPTPTPLHTDASTCPYHQYGPYSVG